MSKNSKDDLNSKVVVIGGQRITIGQLQRSHAVTEFLNKGSATKVVQVLLTAKEPLTRVQIAHLAELSTGYTIDILKKLEQSDFIIPFRLSSRLMHYALTEKGYSTLGNRLKNYNEKFSTEKHE